MEKWIGTIGALVGVLVGGLITYTSTNKQLQHQTRVEQQRLDIEKLEELHTRLSQMESSYRKTDAWVRYGSGKPPDIDIPFDRINMLVGFYAPELNPDVEHLDKLRDAFGATFAKVIVWQEMRLPPEKIEEQKKKLSTDYEAINQQSKMMQSKVVDVYRKREK